VRRPLDSPFCWRADPRAWTQRGAALALGLCTLALAALARAEPSPEVAPDKMLTTSEKAPAPSQATALSPAPSAPATDTSSMHDRDRAILRVFRALELPLAQNADGSFAYTGRGIDARIDALGGLTMRDKFFQARFVFKSEPLDDHTWVTQFFQIRFNLMARIEKAFGNDPYRSERRAFLEATRELRELLLERNAEQALERMLNGIWRLAVMSVREKKERLFSLWSECSMDTHGQRARCRIEEFIRERCPRGSACEYTDEELARLSSISKAKARFAPYDATE
jgi:hypothetical protein